MRGDTHVRFGGRARKTDPGQPGHRTRARPNRSDTAAIMPGHLMPSITAGQRRAPSSGTPQARSDVVARDGEPPASLKHSLGALVGVELGLEPKVRLG